MSSSQEGRNVSIISNALANLRALGAIEQSDVQDVTRLLKERIEGETTEERRKRQRREYERRAAEANKK